MCGSVWCLLLLLLCPGADEMVLEDKALASQSGWRTYELQRGQNGINSFKRHSDGTFTNDYTHYLDKIKAKDFVQWLASTKREKCKELPLNLEGM
ncbi:glucagon-like [Salmo trutta]|uniref:glucagon-like n=1 Tax=Salmo trutta TaxID=8032 RepID=UPI00112FFE1E|nr:glucagon-like [Salmo trutta]